MTRLWGVFKIVESKEAGREGRVQLTKGTESHSKDLGLCSAGFTLVRSL